ncbi:hydrogenase iron-sulfur subunit [Desulfonatronovibrio magnus]|uniref:hydrogenase iron-sulfur subunit n=1 Tax=Desulfonatronovibrio magnus TaxID=698827 RepID=UPI0005EB88C2|nr:hydrogenase iron-sulfur subunit [Desulfonatronovibrio magnus]
MTTQNFQPVITAFLCKWCSYAAADLAGVKRLHYPPSIRIIKIPCSGNMHPEYILQAFREGADGVWVSGCHPGNCHYNSGNLIARRRFAVFKNLLDYIGIEPERIRFSWISSSEAANFQAMAEDVVQTITRMGPARRLVKNIIPEQGSFAGSSICQK